MILACHASRHDSPGHSRVLRSRKKRDQARKASCVHFGSQTFEGSTMRERRSSPRYPANRTILLRWENGEEARARLENISQGGAAIRIESPPPGSGTVLVCIDDAPQQPGAQASILK